MSLSNTFKVFANDYQLYSPNRKINVCLSIKENIEYSLTSENLKILEPSPISLTINGRELGITPRLLFWKQQYFNQILRPRIYKKNTIVDTYNEYTFYFKQNFSIVFRIYDNGMAYRFVTDYKGNISVQKEVSEFKFIKDYFCWIQYANRWGKGDKFYSTFENDYTNIPLSKVAPADTLIVPPMIIDLGSKKIAITEADLEDYPGMFIQKGKYHHSLEMSNANYPHNHTISGDEFVSSENLEEVILGDRKDYLAVTKGKRSFPWRIIAVEENEFEFANNDMVYLLAAPSRIKDESWIKPGKVSWDWWIECDLWGVDFQSGVNYDTYKEYIDFAHKQGLEYIMIDVGFSEINDVMAVNPALRLPELLAYANEKNVGIIAWCGWLAIKDQMEKACAHYSKMGIKGFKVDYMNRDDQPVVNFYYDLAKTAAKYKLLLDFHGAYKPTGLQRTYPNVLTFEGVKGQEWCRWTNPNQPKHAVTVPFLRMLAGPMDFTPGVFRSESKDRFKPSWIGSMGQGTRAHQMAMYTVFESPLQMLSDSPSRYMEQLECTNFISSVPTIWDETRVLNGKIGEYITMTRRKEKTWYIGAMTSWNEREMLVDLSFLPDGKYQMEAFADGANANRYAQDYVKMTKIVSNKDIIKAKLASGGGWTAKLTIVE